MGKPDLDPFQLPSTGLPSQLQSDLNYLAGSRSSDWMTFGLEAAANVDWLCAATRGFTTQHGKPPISLLKKSKIFAMDNFSNGEAIVDLCEIDIFGSHTRCFVRF